MNPSMNTLYKVKKILNVVLSRYAALVISPSLLLLMWVLEEQTMFILEH